MSPAALPDPTITVAVPALVDRKPGRLLARIIWALVKVAIGATLCQYFLGSFIVLGWAQQAAQRAALRRWWRSSPFAASDISFGEFTGSYPDFARHEQSPNWFLGARLTEQPSVRRNSERIFGSLWLNLRLGIQASFNTSVLTLPGCLIMAVAWSAGWQNSFNKGYENAWYGPVGFITGMILFSLSMCYVPLAQARQAVTGNWKSFYDFKIIYRVLQRRWLGGLGVAVVTALASALAAVFKMAPVVFQYIPQLRDLPPLQALVALERYFWVAGAVQFGLLLLCRTVAARVYANGLSEAYQRGTIGEGDLGEFEWHALRRLGLLEPKARQRRTWPRRLASWLATRTGQISAAAAMLTVWFALSFWVLITEFIAKTEFGRGTWNQPLIQLPWVNYTPSGLRRVSYTAPRAAPEVRHEIESNDR